ncbi:MAG: alpha/beta hydrolase [Lautropia sp.]|nr:alpha/beta hydrolase [Lautropia sp.]
MPELSTLDVWIDTDKGRLFARRWYPEGGRAAALAPIVMFHESLGCVDAWRQFPAALAQATGREVIAYDRLGFGRSDRYEGMLKPRSFMVEEASDGFDKVKRALGLRDYVGYGHSVGGAIAMCCAVHHPTSCVGVISESAVVFVEERTVAGLLQARQTFADQMQFERLLKYHGDKSRWVLDAWLDTWMSEEMKHWSHDEILRQVHCPVLAIQGGNDEFSTHDQPRHIADQVPGETTIAMLDDCGHVPHREKPAEVLQACRHWLMARKIG